MKKFTRIDENIFTLKEEPEQRDGVRPHPYGQVQRAKAQLENFVSMLEQYDEEGLDNLVRDMGEMIVQIRNRKPIETY